MEERLKLALAEKANTIIGTKGNSAFAQMVTEIINPNQLTFDVFNGFIDVKQVGSVEEITRKVRRFELPPVQTFVPNTQHSAFHTQTNGQLTGLYMDQILSKVRSSVDELLRGEAGTVQSLRADLEQALIQEIIVRIFDLIGRVWAGTTSRTNYLDASSTGITETSLESMIETVLQTAGNVRAIVGTRAALWPVYKFGGWAEHVLVTGSNAGQSVAYPIQSVLATQFNGGHINSFRGVPIIELPQIKRREMGARYDQKLIPEDRILVIGDNAGEAFLIGGTRFQDMTDLNDEPASYSMALWRKYGFVVDFPENIGYIKVTPKTTFDYIVP